MAKSETVKGEMPAGAFGPLRRLYDWVVGWAETPYGLPALFIIAFAEASFFPIPPDVLLIALAVGAPHRALQYGAVCTVGSALGAVAGWFVGLELYELVGSRIIEFYGIESEYAYVAAKFRGGAFIAILLAAFTPIPFKVFTIAAGAFDVGLGTLFVASAVGRGARFMLVAALLKRFGFTIKNTIDRYFNLAVLLFGVLLVLGILAGKYLL